jgi:pyruvate/oxaloacetate carboxyltransferase
MAGRNFVSMKRKGLKVLMQLMMAIASFGSPMNPKEIEDLMHTMNETRIEFTIPDETTKEKAETRTLIGKVPGGRVTGRAKQTVLYGSGLGVRQNTEQRIPTSIRT